MAAKITGMDRLAAMELQELFDTQGLANELSITEPEVRTGKASDLGALTAILINHPSSEVLLLLTSWIVSKGSGSLTITQQDPKTGELRKVDIRYKHEGAAAVLKQLKALFSD